MKNWGRTDEEQVKNWYRVDEKLMKKHWITEELKRNWWRTDGEPMKIWWITNEELTNNWGSFNSSPLVFLPHDKIGLAKIIHSSQAYQWFLLNLKIWLTAIQRNNCFCRNRKIHSKNSFWYRTIDISNKSIGVDGRGLGW